MKRIVIVCLSIVLLATAFVVARLVLDNQRTNDDQSKAELNHSGLVREHSPNVGSADARVTIVEFFDPACGTCKAFHPIVKNIIQENQGKVKLVVRYMPLHRGSDDVVRMLEAARIQGKFWETLEVAYATQGQWTINHQAHPDRFWRSVSSVGLDAEQVFRDMQSQEVLENIQLDKDDGIALGVDKTPGFFVNGKPLFEFGQMQLLQLVNRELKREYGD